MILHLNPSEQAALARALNGRITILQARLRDGDNRPTDEADVAILDPIRRRMARAAASEPAEALR